MKRRTNRSLRWISLLLTLICCISCFSITAYAQAKEPKLNVTQVTMLKDQAYTVQIYRLTEDQTVSFSIQDESIATITQESEKSCTFTALAVGKTTLVASISQKGKKSQKLKCVIRVTPPAVSVRFKKAKVKLESEGSINLRTLVTVKPSSTAEVPVFTVSDEEVLRVTPNGFATANSAGKVIVTATIANGKSDQITVIVEDSEEDA